MRSVTRIPVVAAGIAVVALSVATGQASAGGPTSVLIVNPSTNETASLYATESTYARLLDALEPVPDEVAGKGAPLGLRGGPGSTAINVTWLLHDVTVWRVDRIQLDADGDPWVQTVESLTAGDLWGSKGPWRRPAEPDRLLTTLDQLGVVGSEPAPDASRLGAARDGCCDSDAAMPRDTGTDTGLGIATGWWWLLPGAAMGVAIGALGRPYAATMLNRRKSGPRQQLIDV